MLELLKQQNQNATKANIFKLAQGLTVIHQYVPTTPVVVADVWVKAGAITEPLEWSGMAHFLEHMIFKGTKTIGPGIFDQIIETKGGMTNAATSYDYAHFYITIAAQYLSETLPYLARLLQKAAIPEDEFFKEREVVIEELHSCYDDPDWLGFQALLETIYQSHPYGRNILGEENLLLKYSPNQMRCFHSTYYQPENMTVVLVGGIEQETALSLVNKCFDSFQVRSECPPVNVEAEAPLIEIRRSQIHLHRIEHARLLMGWIGPGVENIHDAFGLDILSVILGVGRSSRLVRDLLEDKQWVMDISSEFSLQKESSLFIITVHLEQENIERVEESICKKIEHLQKEGVTEEELAKAKRLLCNDFIFSTEAPSQLASLYGYYDTIASAELCLIYPAVIQGFSQQEIQRLANQYLSTQRYGVTEVRLC